MKIIKNERGFNVKIQKVYINGFKNIVDTELNLNKITSLIGLNNYGKSNIIQAINVGINFMKVNNIVKTKIMTDEDFKPNTIKNSKDDFKFELELSTNFKGDRYVVVYGYSFKWGIAENLDCKIINEFLKIRKDEKSQKYKMLINRKLDSANYTTSETGRCSTIVQVEDNELVINKILHYDNLYYLEILKNLNNINIYLENNLDAKQFYVPSPIIIKGIGDAQLNEENLPKILNKLKENYKDKYELLINIFKTLFPNIEEIDIKTFKLGNNLQITLDESDIRVLDEINLLYVKDRNLISEIDFQNMSDGTKRVFMILTRITMASIDNVSLVIIEEPENSIHPELFKFYIQSIEMLMVDNCKILLTSHSPYMLDILEINSIYLGLYNNYGLAQFKRVKNSKTRYINKQAESLEIGLGEYMFGILRDSIDDDEIEGDFFE